MNVRSPPIKELMAKHLPNEPGKCCWCGLKIDEKTPTGRESKASWHPACLHDYKIIMQPSYARDVVYSRDRGICKRCGKDARLPLATKPKIGGFPGEVIDIPDWRVEHLVPLWKVADMPPEQRIEYFRISNMETWCFSCCTIKSAKEASERAHHKRLRKPKDKGESRWPSRSMGNPNFKRKVSGETVKR